MHTKDYVQAAYEILEKSTDTSAVLESLRTYLKKRGLSKLYPAILRGVIEKMDRKQKSTVPKVSVARVADLKKYENEISQVLGDAARIEHEVIVDPSLIGGFIAQNRDTRLDKSFKNKLLHAYRSLID